MNVKDLIAALNNYRMISYLTFKSAKSDREDAFQKVINILLEEDDEDWEFDLPEPIHNDEDDDWPDELKEGLPE